MAGPIPLVLITVGGLCVLSGLKKTNPISLIKDALSGTPIPGNVSSAAQEYTTRTDTSATPTGAGSANSAEHDAPNGYQTGTPQPGNTYNQRAV